MNRISQLSRYIRHPTNGYFSITNRFFATEFQNLDDGNNKNSKSNSKSQFSDSKDKQPDWNIEANNGLRKIKDLNFVDRGRFQLKKSTSKRTSKAKHSKKSSRQRSKLRLNANITKRAQEECIKAQRYVMLLFFRHLFPHPPQQKNVIHFRPSAKVKKQGFHPDELVPLEPKITEDGVTYAVAGRKSSKARLWLRPGEGAFIVNKKPLSSVFPTIQINSLILLPLKLTELFGKVDVICSVQGGGPTGQSGAIRAALVRALLMRDPEKFYYRLKILNLLQSDTRKVEEKKAGLRKARRPTQWVKR